MTLGVLLHALADRTGVAIPAVTPPESELTVSGIAYDSRDAKAGSVFVALKGLQADGTGFVRDAIARGAIAAVAETSAPPGVRAVWVEVPDARLALAALSAALHGDPSERLILVGITGTNGKTTVSYLLSSIFEAAGVPCGRIGTVGHRVGRRDVEAARTTPEAPELQAMLRDMVAQGCGACVMEVSSHALALKRADHLRFAAGVFTNLTRDHLDFHRNMEEYFAAKRRLFELLPDRAVAVVNLDDRRGADLMRVAHRHLSYAIDAAAEVRPVSEVASSFDGLAFTASTPRGLIRVHSPLVGRANTYNILAAVAAATALDLPAAAIERGIAALAMVPGRFQLVSDRSDDVRVVVDYAHTDDALKNLLETARPLATGRVITVFGCGGDRDPTKRPLMGAVAARLSDLVIVTSDNPRSEDPAQIIEQIMRGIGPEDPAGTRPRNGARQGRAAAVVDRKAAIERAAMTAAPGDLVLIAGKGHEKYQVIGDRVMPFDDVDVARAALDRRRSGRRVS